MSEINERQLHRVFIFLFKGVVFNTDEGDGQDEGLSNYLNEKYGHSRIEVHASSHNEALQEAISNLTEMSGFCVLDADYDMQVS